MPDEVDYFIGFETITHIGNERLKRVRVSYYQWAPLILLIQGLCFYIPFLIWNSCANNAGVKLRRLLKKASDIASLPPGCQQREALLAEFVDQFHTLVTGEAGWCADLRCKSSLSSSGSAAGGSSANSSSAGGHGGSSSNSSATSGPGGPLARPPTVRGQPHSNLDDGRPSRPGRGPAGQQQVAGQAPPGQQRPRPGANQAGGQQATGQAHHGDHHGQGRSSHHQHQSDEHEQATGCCLVSIPIIGSLIACCLKPCSSFGLEGPSKYLSLLYLAVKSAYVFNVGLQFYLLGQFLGRGYLRHGVELISRLVASGDWWSSPRFPLSTLCQVRADMSGGLRSYTCQCVLPINVFNEKIFSVVWFYMAFLMPLNVLSLLFWIYRVFETNRLSYIRLCLWRTRIVELNHIHRTVRRLSQSYLGWDGVFVLRLIEHNHGSILATLIMSRLWEFYANQLKLQEDAYQLALTTNAQHTLATTNSAISNQHQLLAAAAAAAAAATNQQHQQHPQHPQQGHPHAQVGGQQHLHLQQAPGQVGAQQVSAQHPAGAHHGAHQHGHAHGPGHQQPGHFNHAGGQLHQQHQAHGPAAAALFAQAGQQANLMGNHGPHAHHSGQVSGQPGQHPLHAANAAHMRAHAHQLASHPLAAGFAANQTNASLLAQLHHQASSAPGTGVPGGGVNAAANQQQQVQQQQSASQAPLGQQSGNVAAAVAALAAAAAAATSSATSANQQAPGNQHQYQQNVISGPTGSGVPNSTQQASSGGPATASSGQQAGQQQPQSTMHHHAPIHLQTLLQGASQGGTSSPAQSQPQAQQSTPGGASAAQAVGQGQAQGALTSQPQPPTSQQTSTVASAQPAASSMQHQHQSAASQLGQASSLGAASGPTSGQLQQSSACAGSLPAAAAATNTTSFISSAGSQQQQQPPLPPPPPAHVVAAVAAAASQPARAGVAGAASAARQAGGAQAASTPLLFNLKSSTQTASLAANQQQQQAASASNNRYPQHTIKRT